MNNQILLSLVQNAALLMLIVYLYELACSRLRLSLPRGGKFAIGLGLGMVGIAIMSSPMYVTAGLFFDARTVLTGVSGLFFGWLPTLITMLMTGAYRFYLGGAGALGGVGTIVIAGGLGLLWRRWRRDTHQRMGLLELYLFGLMANGLSLALLVVVLGPTSDRTQILLDSVALPFILILPIATALLGHLIGDRIESRQQEVELEQSEAHLQALYKYAPIPLWKEDRSEVQKAVKEIRANGHQDIGSYLRTRPSEAWRLAGLVKLLDVNEAALALAGANSLAEITGSVDRFFDDRTIDAFIDQMVLVAEGQSHYQGESFFIRLDGEVRQIVISLFVLPGHEQDQSLVMVSTMDITEHRNYETEIRESYKLLSNLSEHVPGMIFQYEHTLDGDGHYPYVSKGVENIYGVTQAQVNTDPGIISSCFHPEDRASVVASIEYSMRTLEPWHEEYRVVKPDGSEGWVSGSAQPQRQENGSTVWHGYVRDITERKRSETRLQLASRVFESASEAIMVTDAESNIIAINPAFTRVTGYEEHEIVGRDPSLLGSGRHDESFFRNMWASLKADGTWTGDIWNRRKSGEVFPEWLSLSAVSDPLGRVQQYVAVYSDLTEIHRAQLLAERMALEDAMTGLGNRSAFVMQLEKRVAELTTNQRYAGMVLFDIDRFKEVNETHGLLFGDQMLKGVAMRLRQLLGLEHFVARVGADEFAILLAYQSASRDEAGRNALEMAEQLRRQLGEAFRVADAAVDLKFSTGIVVFPENPEDSANDVLQQAEWATRQSHEHDDQPIFFQTAMGQQIRDRYCLEQELRIAAADNQLRVYVQPQVNSVGKQVSAEALIRWQHPVQGLIPPGMFIPLAESSDLIFDLERWMLREVCQLLAQLDMRAQGIRISINISAKHFEREDFVDEVRRQLSHSGADPSYLVFEITESIIIDNMAAVTARMLDLASMGIHFSLDDFGTGYSSLAYLKRLPIHELKIDRSFIMDAPTDASDAALVETILGVARTLGLQVVAEGVETQAQADFLKARGDVIHQGYLYDKPLPLAEWLDKYFD